MKFVLRNANVNDIDNLARVTVKSWHETYSTLIPEGMAKGINFEDSLKDWRKIFVDMVNDADRAIFVIENETSDIVGFASCGASSGRSQQIIGLGEIYDLFMRKDYQGYGLGKALMLAVSRWLISRGLFTGGIWVATENSQGCRFCEDLGATQSTTRNSDRHGNEIEMTAYVWNDFSEVAQLEGAVPNWEGGK